MSNPMLPTTAGYADLERWVRTAEDDPDQQAVRRVIRIIIHAVAHSDELRELMVIKGGVLLAAAYHTGRHTMDVDFSTRLVAREVDIEGLCQRLNIALESSSAILGESLACRVQSKKLKPPGPQASFPTLRVRVGYAERGSKEQSRLERGSSPHVVIVDLSFNEELGEPVTLCINDHGYIKAYSLTAQIAEKYRALIQQPERDRVRRQDAYDIFCILEQGYFDLPEARAELVAAIRDSCRSRNVKADADSMKTDEIRRRARLEFDQLQFELDRELPDFEQMFDRVADFYAELPWGKILPA